MDPVSGCSTARSPERLQDRLTAFAVAVCKSRPGVPVGQAMERFGDQVTRSACSVAANYAEARAAESRRDFVHKMQICLKELRETGVWLEILGRIDTPDPLQGLVKECDELTGIFVGSIKTAKKKM